MALERLALGLRRKPPVVLQTEAAECGLACIGMIAGHHGHRLDLPALRRRFPFSLRGSTLLTLIDVANRLGLVTRPLRLELEDLGRLRLPCILHWNFNHFVVLTAASTRGITIHDPASGERRLPLPAVSDAFTGVALELWPSPAFRPEHETRTVRLRELTGPLSGLYRSLAQVLLLALALELFAILSPLFMQWVVDHALLAADRDLLTVLAVGFGLLVLLQQGTTALRSWVIMHLGATLAIQWQGNVLTHLLRLPVSYFEKRHLGDTVSRFRSIDAIRRTLTTSFVEAIADGAMTVLTLAVIFLYSPVLSLISVVAVALYALSRWLSYRPLRSASHEQIVHAARQESHFLETVRGVRAVRLFQRENERRSRWLALLVEQINAGVRVEKLGILCRLVNGLLFGIENVLVIWLGAGLVLDGQFSAGMLIAFVSYKNQFAERVGALIEKLVELKMLRLHGERLADIVLSEPEDGETAHGGNAVAAAGPEASIRLEGLRYRYAEHDPWVLDGIDMTIRAGESVAIVGPSGCGKTTLLNLMLGVLKPTGGKVLIGNLNLADTHAARARRMIASVLQDDTLFAGSIADNISFFDGDADQTLIEQCAMLASVHAEIVRMPMGYNTFVGHMGSVLSSGQRQRVLLARALYRRPAILVLDEATSHLDLEREAAVNEALARLDITRVIVAHRPQTAATADRIIRLESGRVVSERRLRGDAGAEPAGANRDAAAGVRSTGA